VELRTSEMFSGPVWSICIIEEKNLDNKVYKVWSNNRDESLSLIKEFLKNPNTQSVSNCWTCSRNFPVQILADKETRCPICIFKSLQSYNVTIRKSDIDIVLKLENFDFFNQEDKKILINLV